MNTKEIEKLSKTKKPVMIWVLVALVVVGIIIGATMCRGKKTPPATVTPVTATQPAE